MSLVKLLISRDKRFVRAFINSAPEPYRRVLALHCYYTLLTHETYHPYIEYIGNIISHELGLTDHADNIEHPHFGDCLFFELHKQLRPIARFALFNGFLDLIVHSIQETFDRLEDPDSYIERYNTLMEICGTV